VSTPKKKRRPLVTKRPARRQNLQLHARCFHTTARRMAAMLQLDPGPFNEVDAAPVFFLYRHALEIQLKAIVLGDGGNFLPTKPDRISTQQSRAIVWLAKIVCQMVTATGLQPAFKCPGIETLADFKTFVGQLTEVDPAAYTFRLPINPVEPTPMAPLIGQFADQMDSLLELLDAIAGAIAATWALQSETPINPTIQ